MNAYCDGGCLGNGTDEAQCYGSYKIGKRDPIRLKFPVVQASTNNEAEYQSLIALLEELRHVDETATINCDSALVVNQVNGRWKIKSASLHLLCNKARELLLLTQSRLQWVSRDIIVQVLGH